MVGYVALVGMILLFLLMPIRLIMWQVKFGGIRTADLDYKRARREILAALGLWLLMIVVLAVLMFL